jgi:hypothetical protein
MDWQSLPAGWVCEGLFDHLGDQVKAILGCRGNGLKAFALVGLGHFIGAQALDCVQRMSHGDNTISIDGLQLVNQSEDIRDAVGHLVSGVFRIAMRASSASFAISERSTAIVRFTPENVDR